jgi:hypothetical protein
MVRLRTVFYRHTKTTNQVGKQGRKKFFFEKKNQKTFVPRVTYPASGRFKNQKFFASFSQKRSASAISLTELNFFPDGH